MSLGDMLLESRNPNSKPCPAGGALQNVVRATKVIMDRIKNDIEAVKELKRCAVGLRVYGNLDTELMCTGEMEGPQSENRTLQSGVQSLQSIQNDEINENG